MEIELFSDAYFMREALKQAQIAFEEGEIPVGAVVVSNNKIIARAHNLTQRLNDVTAHAEMQAITAAANHLGSKYLHKCTLYVTLEPCSMCAGALFWSQVERVVYGASDPKRGFLQQGGKLHPKTEIKTGVESGPCSDLLVEFFRRKR
ncbi:MAG: nucleoside deaminase [Schleiferiaceae bacterium]